MHWRPKTVPPSYVSWTSSLLHGKPRGSDEAGTSCRAWKGLLLAAFMNVESDLYYELCNNWMGKGDKDTFALALAATHTPYSLITTPVGSVGITGQVQPCQAFTSRMLPYVVISSYAHVQRGRIAAKMRTVSALASHGAGIRSLSPISNVQCAVCLCWLSWCAAGSAMHVPVMQ